MQRRWLDVRGTGPRWDNCLQRVRRGGIKQNKKKNPQLPVMLLFHMLRVCLSCTNADWQPSDMLGPTCPSGLITGLMSGRCPGQSLTTAWQPRGHEATWPFQPCAWVAEAVVTAPGRVQLSSQCLCEVLAQGASASWLFGHCAEVAALARRLSLQLALPPAWFWTVPSDYFCVSTFTL